MATNFAKATYQEIYDIQTQSGTLSIFGIHTPTSIKPRTMLQGFWSQFRKVKYLGCDVSLIPSAQLPADPLQVSYEAGEATSDPRDLLNPILFHGAHGSSLSQAWNSIFQSAGTVTTPSIDVGSSLGRVDGTFDEDLPLDPTNAYYNALSDPTFRKFSVMSGVRLKNLYPLVHVSGTNLQVVPPYYDSGDNFVWNGGTSQQVASLSATSGALSFSVKAQRMGWLPTTVFPNASSTFGSPIYSKIPRIFMGLLILPPSYKTELYFRMILTHRFAFKDFSTSLVGLTNTTDLTSTGVAGNDYTNLMEDTEASAALLSAADENSVEVVGGTASLTTSGVS